jgi:hypothetical protein
MHPLLVSLWSEFAPPANDASSIARHRDDESLRARFFDLDYPSVALNDLAWSETMTTKLMLSAAFALSAALLAPDCRAQTSAPVTQESADAVFGSKIDPRAVHALSENMGIWKAVVPPVKMPGAFADHDPIGVAAGKLIPADCSINWTDPDTHKLYCFTSATSLVYFLTAPHTNIGRATKSWLKLMGS